MIPVVIPSSIDLFKTREKILGLTFIFAGVIILSNCGGGGSASSGGTQPPPIQATTMLQTSVGDDPCDRVAALLLNMTSVTLTSSSGGQVTVVATPTSVEFMHLMGSLQSLSLVNVDQGTYTKATISIASATITYLNPANGQLTQQTLNGPWNVTINLNPALSAGAGPLAINLHLDVNHSVGVDGHGNITFDPSFRCDGYSGGSGGDHDRQHGGLDHVVGSVTSISGNSFILTMLQSSQTVTVNTDSHTEFKHIGGISGITAGMIVVVDADLQSDGSLLAREVSVSEHESNGMQAEALIVSIAGNPATQLSVLAHDGSGPDMHKDDLGGTITVNLDANTNYSIDSSHADLTNLPFTPIFDSSNIYKAQKVQVVSNTGMHHDGMGPDDGGCRHDGTITAAGIELDEQGLHGTVSNYSQNITRATFTLNVSPDSVFTSLTGAGSVTIYQQPGTRLWQLTGVRDGTAVEVHGLLFVNSSSYQFVATRIAAE